MQTLSDASKRTVTHDACAEDACGCHDLSHYAARYLPHLFAFGVNAVAAQVQVAVIEELRAALRYCVRECCPAHGDADDVVDELQAVINEADALDDAYWAQREETAVSL